LPSSTLTVRGDHITLVQAVKRVGLAETGGQAKHLVRTGTVRVNGEAEDRPARKLHPGDRFGIEDQEWLLVAETDDPI